MASKCPSKFASTTHTVRTDILVEIYEKGRMTSLVAEWKVGDVVEWRGPYGVEDFFRFQKCKRLLLVAGGTGIAPFVRVIDDILMDDDSSTMIRLVYCVASPADMIFIETIKQWAKHWNIVNNAEVPYLLRRVGKKFDEDAFSDEFGALKKSQCNEDLAVVVCGNTTLEKDVINWAERVGIAKNNILRFPP